MSPENFRWADDLADDLDKQVAKLWDKYRRIEKKASSRTGEDRLEYLEQMIELRSDIQALTSRISSLRGREKH